MQESREKCNREFIISLCGSIAHNPLIIKEDEEEIWILPSLQKRKDLILLIKFIRLCVINLFSFFLTIFPCCSIRFKCELAYGQTH